MSRKGKGINAERELIHLFWQSGWAAVRIAGSGSSQYPSADVLASNAKIKLAIEAKTTKDSNKYFTEEEISQLKQFCTLFGAQPILALKFKAQPWYFIKITDLSCSGKHLGISAQNAKALGKTFDELISTE